MKTMRQVLAERDEQHIEELVRLWLVEGRLDKDLTARREALTKRVQDPIVAHFVWERLSTHERKILYHTLTPSTRYGIRSDMLKKKVQLPTAQYDEALDSLVQRVLLQTSVVRMKDGQIVYNASSSKKQTDIEDVTMVYAFNESVDTLYPVGRAIFTPANDRSKMTLDKILGTLHENDLYQIMQNYALQWGVYHSHSELRTMMAEKILALDNPLNTLTKLERRAQTLFTWLYERGGRATMPEVRKFIGFSDVVLISMLHSLAHGALAFNTFSKDVHVLFIPDQLYSGKQNIVTSVETESSAFVALENLPTVVRPDEPVVIYDMAVLINAIYQQAIEPTQAGRIPKRIATKLRPMLRGRPRLDYQHEDQYLEMLLTVMTQLGLTELLRPPIPDMKARYEPGRRLTEWAELGMTQQLRVLMNTWVTQGGLTDIAGIHYQPWDPYSWKVGEARNTLLIHLSECSAGQWYTIDSMIQHIWVKDTFGARPTLPPGQQAAYHKSRDMRAKWYKAEGEAYTGMLASTLHEMGIVAVGYEQADALAADAHVNPYAFMLTELGADVLINSEQESSAPAAPPAQRTLVVQPSFELLLLHPDLKTLYSLLPFVQVNQLSVASRFTLTRASVLRGMEAGLTLEHMLQVLQAHSQKDLPQNVVYTLQDWTKHYKDVKVSQVLLLDVSSEEAAQTILQLSMLQGAIIRQLGPCTIAVDITINVQELKQILEKQGIFTRISGDMPISPGRSMFTYGMHR